MPDAKPYEAVSSADTKQWTHEASGKTFQAYDLTAKNEAGETVSVNINRLPSSLPPAPGETVWLEVWETDYGLKGKKMQGPRQTSTGQASFTPDGSRDRSIIRQHSQHMALLWAAEVARGDAEGPPSVDLKTIEAWTDHFDADVQRASGAAQNGETTAGEGSSPRVEVAPGAAAPPRAPNGEAKISDLQIQNFILKRQKLYGISDEDMALLVKSFGVEKLKDLPRSKVDAFAAAMPNPIPTGESDVPSEPIPTPASEADSEIPF